MLLQKITLVKLLQMLQNDVEGKKKSLMYCVLPKVQLIIFLFTNSFVPQYF